MDDLKERRGYSHLKEEALDRTMWRARFGRGFGPFVRQTTKWTSLAVGRTPFDDSVQTIPCFRAISVTQQNTGSKPWRLDKFQIPVFDLPDDEDCNAPPKRKYLCTNPHGVISHKALSVSLSSQLCQMLITADDTGARSVLTFHVPIPNLLLVFLCTRFRLHPFNRPVPFLRWEFLAYKCFPWTVAGPSNNPQPGGPGDFFFRGFLPLAFTDPSVNLKAAVLVLVCPGYFRLYINMLWESCRNLRADIWLG